MYLSIYFFAQKYIITLIYIYMYILRTNISKDISYFTNEKETFNFTEKISKAA